MQKKRSAQLPTDYINTVKLPLFLIAALLLTSVTCHASLDSLFYHPDHRLYATPAQDGYAFENVMFKSVDGTRLNGWFIQATGNALGTVIHYHGNAQNMTAHYSFVSWLPANSFNLFVFDYRGYGKSEGIPSRKGVYEDSVAALEYIKSRTDIDQRKIIVFGQSIGGANALTVVGRNHFKGIVGVVSESAFSSYKRVACEHAGWLKPLAYCLISNKLSPEEYIGDIAPIPLLIIHGTNDPIARYNHAKILFKKAAEPKQLWTIEGGGHISALGPHRTTFVPELLALFVEWVNEVDNHGNN